MPSRNLRHEEGYSLLSVLLLIVILILVGTLIVQNLTTSQNMVNVSENMMKAQADGETKLMLKVSDVRKSILDLQNEKDSDVTLDQISDAAAPYVDPDTVILDSEKKVYTAVVSSEGISNNIKQIFRQKIEIQLSEEPDESIPDSEISGDYALASQGQLTLSRRTTILGHVFSGSGLNQNDATIKGKTILGSVKDSNLSPPPRLNFIEMMNQMSAQAEAVRKQLSPQTTNPAELVMKDGSRSFDQSVAIGNLTMYKDTKLLVKGDLYINGSVNMQGDNSIIVTGDIYVTGSMSAKGTQIQAGNAIYVGGSVNLDDPHADGITIIGDLYTPSSLSIHTTLTAGKIFAAGSIDGNVRGHNRFSLYSGGSIAINDSSSITSITGTLYANGNINVNGNNGLTIRAGNPGTTPTPKEPAKIIFNEGAMLVN